MSDGAASKKIRVRSESAKDPGPGLWSECLKVGDHFWVSGQTALNDWWDGSGGVTFVVDGNDRVIGPNDAYKQTQVALARIKALTEAAGGTIDDLVKMTIYVTDIRYRPDVVRARTEWLDGIENPPTVALVGVNTLAQVDILVEIDAQGVIGCGNG
jgi:2-iminobutanoate/2-iminopropanoate deaminase